VPGWCAVYWIKMLNDIEVLDQPDMNYWTTTGYRYPDTPHATVKPGEKGFKLVPVTRNLPRSFITNIQSGDTLPAGAPSPARGIAFGGEEFPVWNPAGYMRNTIESTQVVAT